MLIYKSKLPPVSSPEVSIASFVYPESDPFPPTSPAFIDAKTGRVISRGQLRSLSLELGWGLRNGLAELGGCQLHRGDTAAIFSPNCLAYPIALHACFMAGLRVTVVNSSYTTRELAHQFKDSAVKIIFVHPTLLETTQSMFCEAGSDFEARRRIVILQFGGNSSGASGLIFLEELLGKGRLPHEEKFDGVHSEDTALICYSSGTTGKPKGVELMHKNLVATISLFSQANDVEHGKDITLGFLPFYHIYGAILLLLFFFNKGVPLVVMERFDPIGFLKNMEKYKITYATTVPPILVILARHPDVPKYNLNSLRTLMCGAAPLSTSLQQAVQDRLDSLGISARIIQGYGLTEAAPVTYLYDTRDADRKVGSVGKLLSGIEARLVLADDVDDAEEWEHGELWIRGPIVMKGYLNNASATAEAITVDGWFKTGDIATIDEDGYFKIVDRQKELIKYKGFQVPPAELEGVLLEHPCIADAGVVGVQSDAEATELPRAYIVHLNGLRTKEEKDEFKMHLQEWVKPRVAKHKYLRGGVVIVDAIPKSPSGKILRRTLREWAKSEAVTDQQGNLRAKL